MARLRQIHQELNEECIGRKFGVTGEYVRQIWQRFYIGDMSAPKKALESFYGPLE